MEEIIVKRLRTWLAVSVLFLPLWMWASNAVASKDYTVVIENNTDLTTTLAKTASHCMYADGPSTISVDPKQSKQFPMTDDDQPLSECWSAPKTVTWKFADPPEGGQFYFDHSKTGSWSTAFWPEVAGLMAMTVWCGTKENPKAAQCFGHAVSGDFDYFTISYAPKGADVVGMRFVQGAEGDLTLKRLNSVNMADNGRPEATFAKEEDFYIQKAAVKTDSIVKWQVSNSRGSTVLHYVNSFSDNKWHTQILVDSNPPSNAPEVETALCDGKNCLSKSVPYIPKALSIEFGVAD